MATATREPRTAKTKSPASDTAPDFTFALARSLFAEALGNVALALPKRGVLPILNTVLVRAGERALSLTCSNLEQTVETSTGATVSGAGAVALPCAKLVQIVGSLPTGCVIEVTVRRDRATLKAGKSRFEIIGLPVAEWPLPEDTSFDGEFSASGKELVDALNRLAPIASTAMSRPAFNAAFLEIPEDAAAKHAFLVTTDGNRLARATLAVTRATPVLHGGFNLPRQAFAAVTKLFANDEDVSVKACREMIRIVGKRATFTTRLVVERFPNYQFILAHDSIAFATVDREAFREVVKRVAIMTDKESVALELTRDAMRVVATGSDAGEGEDELPVVFEPGKIDLPYAVTFNTTALIDALGAVTGKDARLDFAGSKKPLYVRNAAEPESAAVATMLPLGQYADAPAASGGSHG